jgi:asparagine synthase (glutamine-hydrolysing)
MCGIHGFLWRDEPAMQTMLAAAKHRGPDGSGAWSNNDITLGHNLLSIVDAAQNAQQPWIQNDIVLVYNGEIYNYKELRKGLRHQFRTDTDTEVLAVGLLQQGTKFIYELDGMFAFACYNINTKQLILARDSNGAKPLFYGTFKGKLAFSSEVKSLLTLGFDRKVSVEGFGHYYHSGLTSGPITCFENINRLSPGEILDINIASGKKTSCNLNDVQIKPYDGKIEVLPQLLTEKLNQAVKMTSMGRRNIGVFLSGGMDSSSIFYEAVQGNNMRPIAVSTRFDTPNFAEGLNEDAYLAAKLAGQYGIDHRECVFTQQDWVSNIERTMLALEEPRQGRSFPAYYLTNKLMSELGAVITLSGDGGDELLVGYKHYANPPYENKIKKFRNSVRSLNNPILNLSFDDQMQYLYNWLPKGGLTDDAVNNCLYIDSLNTLSEDFLIRNDKLGMAFGMEARFPIMCSVFKNFIRSIPSNVKVQPEFFAGKWAQYNKGLFKQAYKNKLPDYILNKKKTGWRAPTDEWLIGIANQPAKNDGPIKQYVRSLLTKDILDIFEVSATDIDNKYFNNKDFSSPIPGKAGIGLLSQKELFTIITFAVWYKQFQMSF